MIAIGFAVVLSVLVMAAPKMLTRIFGEEEAKLYIGLLNAFLILLVVYTLVVDPSSWRVFALMFIVSFLIDGVATGITRLAQWQFDRTIDQVIASGYDEHAAFDKMRRDVYYGKGSAKRKLAMIRQLDEIEHKRRLRRL